MPLLTLLVTVRDATCAVVLGAALVLAAPAAAAAAVGAGTATREPPRLDDLRWLGTHNSYHLRPERPLLPNEPTDYAHAPLDVQLSDQGVRSLELDAWNAPELPVFHQLVVDTASTCPNLETCFRTIDAWSDKHPKHEPLVILVEAKPVPVSTNATVQTVINNATTDLGITNWNAAAFDRLDALVRKSFGRSLITPDDVRGTRRTLREAVVHNGWPTVTKGRGKVLAVLIGEQAELDLYRAEAPLLEGKGMFASSEPTDPSAAVILRDVPDAASRIDELVRQHFIVRTRADAEEGEARTNDHTRADAALASGAQIVATDYPAPDPAVGPYVVALPSPSREPGALNK